MFTFPAQTHVLLMHYVSLLEQTYFCAVQVEEWEDEVSTIVN